MISILRPPALAAVGSRTDSRKPARATISKAHAQRKQQQIAKPAMFDGALGALLEKHERAEGMRRAAILPQQMDPEWQPDGRPRPPETRAPENPLTSSPCGPESTRAWRRPADGPSGAGNSRCSQRLAFFFKASMCASILARYSSRRIRAKRRAPLGFPCRPARPAPSSVGRIFLGIKDVEQDQIVAAKTQRLDGC